jgi:pantoate--beta-alanine ligase
MEGMPEIIRSVGGMSARSAALRDRREGIALVPTMGFLHEGHLSLIRLARTMRRQVAVSIFVNPTQFGPGEDFESYPRNLDRDVGLAGEAGGTIIFAPAAGEMYPEGFQTHVEAERISKPLCGAFRPGHFRGVATVVLKLFNIVRPEVAVFGEKDYQQLAVIRRFAKDLDLGVEIVGHPIVREPDGLALSSRNSYLSPEDRARAVCLYRALREGAAAVGAGERDAGRVRSLMRGIIGAEQGASIEYAAVADPETLEEVGQVGGKTLLALAVRLGGTRLIDNLLVEP